MNAFLPIRPDVTGVRHVMGKVRHRMGFAGEWRNLYSRCPPYVSYPLDGGCKPGTINKVKVKVQKMGACLGNSEFLRFSLDKYSWKRVYMA